MNPAEYARWYFRSALGLASVAAGVGGGLIGLAAGLPLPWMLAGCFAFVSMAGLGSLLSGHGPRAALAARDAAAGRTRAARRLETAALRDRLVRIRLPDVELSDAVSALVLVSGRYLESCAAVEADPDSSIIAYDPAVEAALSEAVELVDLYLREKDESAVERRFALEDAHPVTDARSRVLAALHERAGIIHERLVLTGNGHAPADRLAAREELK
jgi:hypothetical protein